MRLRSLTALFKLAPLACACLLAAGAHAQPRSVRPQRDVRERYDLLRKGQAALARGDDKGAVETFRDFSARFADDPDGWYWLGVALRHGGSLEESADSLRRALKLRRASTTVSAEMAYTLSLAGKKDESAKEAGRAFPEIAKRNDAHYVAALLELNHAMPDAAASQRALEEAEAAIASDPNFAPSYLLKAQALVRTSPTMPTPDECDAAGRRLEEAAQSLEKFLALSPGAADFAFWQQQLAAMRAQSDALRATDAARTVFFPKEMTTKAGVSYRPPPVFSEDARRTQTFGSVRVRVVLAADGSVQHPLALSHLPNGLTESAVEAARSVQFNPAAKDGRHASQFVLLEFNFDIF